MHIYVYVAMFTHFLLNLFCLHSLIFMFHLPLDVCLHNFILYLPKFVSVYMCLYLMHADDVNMCKKCAVRSIVWVTS